MSAPANMNDEFKCRRGQLVNIMQSSEIIRGAMLEILESASSKDANTVLNVLNDKSADILRGIKGISATVDEIADINSPKEGA